MLWLNPAALFALTAIAAPILIHILIQRRAERFPFPTLRFLRPTRLAAIRRHVVEELPLLCVRALLIAAAVAAIAGPLLLTAARARAWDRRVVRAVVRDRARADRASNIFAGASLADGIRRAILWLETAPPARREIVIQSPLPIGSISAADVAQIPADVGVIFERTDTLPAARTVAAGRVLTADGVRAREVTFDADRTTVRDAATSDPITWPIDVVSSAAGKPLVEAAIAAVLSQRVWAGPPDRRARLVLLSASALDLKVRTTSEVTQALTPAVIQQPWMADAVVRITRDPDLRDAAARLGPGLSDQAFAAAPWQTLVSAADGRPLVVAAGSPDRLLVASGAPASDIVTPVLLRAIANAIVVSPDLQRAEVTPIADAVLQQWSRPAAPLPKLRIETLDRDDRRWLWLAVLGLLALEGWMRRPRAAEAARDAHEEKARVA
ncbi:MAG: hypothetical protein JWL71_97 [Acidobacteria bacterium]|nr:hypothetical protein [Acidobacteriota bacterium]